MVPCSLQATHPHDGLRTQLADPIDQALATQGCHILLLLLLLLLLIIIINTVLPNE